MTGFHVGLRCLLLGATLITLGRLDEAEKVKYIITNDNSCTCDAADIEGDVPM